MDLFDLVLSAKLTKGGGGGDIDVDALNVTENGTYSAPSGHAYSPVTVSVPSSGITPTGTKNIASNGMYDVTDFASASVSVPVGVFPSGTSSITANGIYDIVSFASVDVNVSGGGGGDHDAEDGIIDKTISGAYTNSRVTYIGSSAFNYCTSLTSVNFTNATSVGSTAFFNCISLATVSFPNVTSIGGSAFAYCSELITTSFPNVKIVGQSAFFSCKSLATVSFPNVTSIGANAFKACSKLMSVYVLASSVATLGNSAFLSTPMSLSTYTGAFGSIYVPASLVDSYKAANNWSYYSDRITSYVE